MAKKRIALVQFNALPEQIENNLTEMERLARAAKEKGAEWIFFHEGTLADYSPRIEKFAEAVPNGPSTQRLAALSKKLSCVISFGMPEIFEKGLYISQVFVGPSGYFYHYRKTWLCRYDDDNGYRNEWQRFDPGTGPSLFEIEGIRVTCFVCCDGHSPRCIDRAAALKPQVVFHPHNVRFGVKVESLAPEAQKIKAPVLITNRVGLSWTHESPGGCGVLSPLGEVLAISNMEGREEVLVYNLDIPD